MTMDRMDKELRCRGGFDTVTRTYKTKLKMYEFRVTRGEHWAIYHFTYPNGFSSKLVDETQRLFIEQVIKNFNERFKEDKNMTFTDYKMVCNDDGSISMICEPPTINPNPFDIKNVIFNEPATIVFWADGTKTVVKCQEWDEFDPEKGLAMAIAKKAYGNIGHYYENMKKWVDPYYDAQAKMYEEFREAIIEAEAEDTEEEPVWWIWVEMVGLDKAAYFKHEEKSYKRKCDATRVAKKKYGDSTKYNFIVSQENPWL